MDYIYLILGLSLLAVGGECLVKGSVSLALRLKISSLVIGMTVVSFATSAPELLVSLDAALGGYPDISLGNVIGSNIANIGLVLGFTALIFPLNITNDTYITNYPMLLGVSLVFVLLIYQFRAIQFWMGAFFVLFLLIFVFLIIRSSRKKGVQAAQDDEFLEKVKSYPVWKSTTYLVFGGLALYYGADFLINGAISIAREWGVTERVISISVVAIGTSVPELAASVVAAVRKEESLAIGNLLGSNIFNVLAVLGITSLVTDLPVGDVKIFTKDIWIMLGFVILLYPVMRVYSKSTINRIEGCVMLLAYIAYIYFL
tara:strand:+ start:758 stop:1702 length:945 start_codon:yes stop_codon:yes gene_type:complete